MSDGTELLQGVLDNPDDDAPRLVYADWLMEQGDPRGSFITAQIELTQRITPIRRKRAKARVAELYAKLRKELEEPVRSLGLFCRVRRGFIDEVTGSAAKFAKGGSALFAAHPIRRLRLNQVKVSHLENMLADGVIGRLSALGLSGELGHDGAQMLAQSEQLASVSRLNLAFSGLGDDGVAALAKSPHLKVTSLALNDNDITDDGVRALVSWSNFGGCRRLFLSRNGIGDEGVAALAACENIESMKVLSLVGNDEITDTGALAFEDASLPKKIARLELELIDLSDETCDRLASVWGDAFVA